MDFLTYLAKEWSVIGQAPLTFLIAVVLAGLVAYGLARWAFMVRFDTLGERLKLRDEQIADRDRKLGELRQVASSPAPKIEAHGAGAGDYSDVIRELLVEYIFGAPGSSDPDILSGRALPPMDWMNQWLARKGKDWRITAVRGPIAEIGPA